MTAAATRDDLPSVPADAEVPALPIGEAAMMAAGPWLFTVAALALIGRLAAPLVPAATIEGFTLLVVNIFALSMVAAAPVILVAVRRAGDLLHLGRIGEVCGLLVAALATATLAALALSGLALGGLARLPGGTLAIAVAGSAVAAWMWVALAFVTALRDHGTVSQAFFAGLAIALAGSLAAALASGRPEAMALAMLVGLACIVVRLLCHLLARLPAPTGALGAELRALLGELGRRRALAVAGLAAAMAVWVDKWVAWAGPEGRMIAPGLAHAPLYDSAVFTASLGMIPGLVLFLTHLEGPFHRRYRAYFGAIEGHATLERIEAIALRLQHETLAALARIVATQAGIAAIVVLAAPAVVALAGLQYQQIAVLRLAAVGVVFHLLFVAATSLLLYFDRQRAFASLQVLFLVLVAGLTALSMWLGRPYHGAGYLLAALISGLAAFAALEHALRNLTLFTFVIANSGRS